MILPKLYKPGEIVKVEIPNVQITRERPNNWLTSPSVDFSRINISVSKVEEKREINGVSRKPLGCSSCSYRSVGSGFCPDYKGRNAKIAICLEAPGEEEYLRSMPLVGKAGRYWLRTLIEPLGYGREDCLICNSLRCFDSPRTSVFTPQGWRALGKFSEGDLVLTHQKRFRKVEKVWSLPCEQDRVKITWAIGNGSLSHVMVTKDHLFHSSGDWVRADDLNTGYAIEITAERCLGCGNLYHRHFSHFYKSLSFCSAACKNKVIKPDGSKISKSLYEQYSLGIRDPKQIVKACNEITRELVKQGLHNLQLLDDAQRAQSRLTSAIARQFLGLQANLVWIGFGEKEMYELLCEAGYDVIPQFAVENYNYDFKIGEDTLIEVDGPGSRNKHRIEEDSKKRDLAERLGYRVLHVPHDDLKSIFTILDNDNHEFEFIERGIHSVEYLKKSGSGNRRVWTLQVEEDESYVAQGAINHNCRPPGNNYPTGKLRKEAESFCRQYDDKLRAFNPNLFVVSLHPSALLRSSAATRLVRLDCQKAFKFAEEGYKVLLLMGDKAMGVFLPHLSGVKRWRGSYFEGSL